MTLPVEPLPIERLFSIGILFASTTRTGSTVSLKRKAIRANGDPMEPVRVVDANKMPMENRRSIGNGSTGNVIVWQAPYEAVGRKGISSSLTAVQVTNLVEYTAGGVDFDIVEGAEPVASEDLF